MTDPAIQITEARLADLIAAGVKKATDDSLSHQGIVDELGKRISDGHEKSSKRAERLHSRIDDLTKTMSNGFADIAEKNQSVSNRVTRLEVASEGSKAPLNLAFLMKLMLVVFGLSMLAVLVALGVDVADLKGLLK